MTDGSDARVVWPFAPNWTQNYTVAYEFKTDIWTSEDGLEQRRGLRSTPRKSLRYTALAAHDRFRRFTRLIDTAQNLPIVMPEVTRRAVAASPIAADGVTFDVTAVPPWLVGGSEVILSDHANGYTLSTVASIAGSTVTLTEAPGQRDAGIFVHPALTGLLAQTLTAKRATSAVTEISVDFAVDPTSEVYPTTVAPTLFDGYELLTIDPNWISGVEASHLWPVQQADTGRGRITTYRPVEFPTGVRPYDLLGTSATALVDFFVRMRGQRGSFYVSSMEADLLPAGDVGGTTLTIAGTDAFYGYQAHPVKQAIEVYAPGLGSFIAGVTTLTLAGDNTEMTFDQALPAIVASEVARISWVSLARLGSDTLETVFVSTEAVKTRLNVRTLPVPTLDGDNLRVTVDAAVRDTTAGDNRAVIYV